MVSFQTRGIHRQCEEGDFAHRINSYLRQHNGLTAIAVQCLLAQSVRKKSGPPVEYVNFPEIAKFIIGIKARLANTAATGGKMPIEISLLFR